MELLTVQNVLAALGICGFIFGAYNYLRNPQIKSDKTDALLVQQLGILQADLTNLRDNHVHTLDVKLDATNEAIHGLTVKVATLSTIMEERLPKK